MNNIVQKGKRIAYGFLGTVLAAIPLLFSPESAMAQTTFESPLRFKTIEDFVEGILQAFVYIALPVVAFFIVFSGFKFLTAQGNQEKLNEAKRNFYHVIIGASLALGAWALAVLIKGTIDQLRG